MNPRVGPLLRELHDQRLFVKQWAATGFAVSLVDYDGLPVGIVRVGLEFDESTQLWRLYSAGRTWWEADPTVIAEWCKATLTVLDGEFRLTGNVRLWEP